jgi:hypothetical protein
MPDRRRNARDGQGKGVIRICAEAAPYELKVTERESPGAHEDADLRHLREGLQHTLSTRDGKTMYWENDDTLPSLGATDVPYQ